MNLEIDHPWVLLLLPLCLLPVLAGAGASLRYSSLLLIPPDPLSRGLEFGVRVAGAGTIAMLLLGLSGPFLPATQVERLGEGAQIVLLLDRSRSMDQPFGGQVYENPLDMRNAEPKGTIARRVLSEFVSARRSDQYAMLVFSTQPIKVLPLTDKSEPIQAAITAGNVGRGLTDTDVGNGIVAAAKLFDDQPYTGSRLVLLISDGGARLDLATRQQIANLLKLNRVALYWIYISSRNSPPMDVASDEAGPVDTAPARTLHNFFRTLETPYRLFDVEDPDALATAIAEVNRLQSLPIRSFDVVPREQVAWVFYALALALLSLLLAVEFMEKKRWTGEPQTS
ncbi:MAG TPA: vWA domain-containing protein [Woeseiaceae bacterium]|nr:vWA domain-containing protein [Woeseiaceae bacterium]